MGEAPKIGSYEYWANDRLAKIKAAHEELGDEAFIAELARVKIDAEKDRGGAPIGWMAMNKLYSDYGLEVFGAERMARAIEQERDNG
jgi:hypothetical protein